MNQNQVLALALALTLAVPPVMAAESVPAPMKKAKATLYTDLVNQSMHYEFTSYLRLDRVYNKLFNKKVHAEDINVYDEVPDSAFFENRHARNPLTIEQLVKGPAVNDGPADGTLTVTKGKSEGLNPGFFIKDSRGDKYLLKFDPATHRELTTSTESIVSRFYHAFGSHVPQYTVFVFDPSRLVPAEDATMIDRTGFKKKLTQDKLEEFMIQIPLDDKGLMRASASKILKGEPMGAFNFIGRRKDDPEDKIRHEKRRVIRALRVFGSWLNNNDVRRQNTLDMWVTEDGRSFLKHYLIDFNSSFGAAAKGSKPPQFTHEYFVDYGEVVRNMFGFGFRRSDWQKRWDENGKKENDSQSLGYFDNKYFSPEKYKVQLPYYAFKDLTRADGYWAAKIIMAFKDDEIRSLISTGRLSEKENEEYIYQMLRERQEAIGRYWYSQATPAENFSLRERVLTFADIEVESGFARAEDSVYTVEAFSGNGKKGLRLGRLESRETSFELPADWLSRKEKITLLLRAKRVTEKQARPYVFVEINNEKITRALHQD
jgi:hypothetical protein